MKTRLALIIAVFLIVIAFLSGVFFWNQLPDTMASHWNELDQVDGTMPKAKAVFLLPCMLVGLAALFFVIPRIDPLKANIARFVHFYYVFIVTMLAFLLYVHILTLMWNMGYTNFRMSTAMLPAIGLLFILAGLMIRKAKRNYFIGIRTPWTLASDTVWEKTHRLGGILFIIAGVITLAGIFFPDQVFYIILITALGASLISIIYSYLVFRQEESKTKQ